MASSGRIIPCRSHVALSPELGEKLLRQNPGVLVKPLAALNDGETGIVRVELHTRQEHLRHRDESIARPCGKPILEAKTRAITVRGRQKCVLASRGTTAYRRERVMRCVDAARQKLDVGCMGCYLWRSSLSGMGTSAVDRGRRRRSGRTPARCVSSP